MISQKITLSDAQPGSQGRVLAYTKEGREQLRLMELGLLPGSEFKYIRQAPLGDPLELEVKGYNLSLRKQDAAVIEVEIYG